MLPSSASVCLWMYLSTLFSIVAALDPCALRDDTNHFINATSTCSLWCHPFLCRVWSSLAFVPLRHDIVFTSVAADICSSRCHVYVQLMVSCVLLQGMVFFAFGLNLVDCGGLLGGRLDSGDTKLPAKKVIRCSLLMPLSSILTHTLLDAASYVRWTSPVNCLVDTVSNTCWW